MKLTDDPLWYKDAIIYEAHVKSFFDSTNDGIGDFRGLPASSITCRTSASRVCGCSRSSRRPSRDDGYDISDYRDVHPSYGTLDDFKTLVNEAHARGIRVLIELVVNHTSDQHPWFQAARRAPARIARARVLRLERHRPEVPRDADHLHRYGEVELDARPGGRAVLLAPVLLAPARSQSQQPGGRRRRHRRDEVLARSRRRRAAARRGAVSLRA